MDDFIEENHLKVAFQSGIEDGLPIPVQAYPGSYFTTATIISPRGAEKMVVWDRDYRASWDLEKALSFLQNFALDGFGETYEAWVPENEDVVKAYGENAQAYYNYCRDVNQKMRKLLGDEAFSEYINL